MDVQEIYQDVMKYLDSQVSELSNSEYKEVMEEIFK
jgi:hypothetical protein